MPIAVIVRVARGYMCIQDKATISNAYEGSECMKREREKQRKRRPEYNVTGEAEEEELVQKGIT